MLPLDGFRVLDLTRFLSGPYCTMVLAELGADVIKVEQPATGDDSRRLAPKVNGESYPFAMPNRSKRSFAWTSRPSAADLFLELAAEADLVIENFRPGVVHRLGIGYDDVRRRPPRHPLLLDQRLRPDRPVPGPPGLRHHGPGRDGFLRMTGQPDGSPAKVGIAINDIAAGATAIYSIMAAQMTPPAHRRGPVHRHLPRRRRPGVDRLGVRRLLRRAARCPQPTGTRHRRSTPYQAYSTADGYVTIGANNDRLWRRLDNDVLERRSGSRTRGSRPCPTGWPTSTSSSARSRRSP